MEVEGDGFGMNQESNSMVDEEKEIKSLWLKNMMDEYKYVGTIGLDLSDPSFRIRERILGVEVRVYKYLGL